MSPQQILVNISLDFDDRLTSSDVEQVVANLESRIREGFPEVTRLFIEAQSRAAHARRARQDAAAADGNQSEGKADDPGA